MATIYFGDTPFDGDLVIFDKDGTLIDFDHLWGRRSILCVEQLVKEVGGDERLRHDLYRTLGYDPVRHRTAGNGPLAVASMDKLYSIASIVLYQHGLGWNEAESLVGRIFAAGMGRLPSAELIRPLADLRALFGGLARAGVAIAIATTDDRAATAATLQALGVAEWVQGMACGDDGFPIKPAPDAIFRLSEALALSPERTIMVGDTVTDMKMGRNAGVGCRVAVASGVGERAALAAHAELVIDSVAAISPAGAPR